MKVKGILLLVLVTLLVTTPLTFFSCNNDDDDTEESGGSDIKSTIVLKVNGVEWEASTSKPPQFHGSFTGGPIFTRFYRHFQSIEKELLYADVIDLDLNPKIGNTITKGMDLANTKDLSVGGGNSDYWYYEGGKDDRRVACYDISKATGSAVILDFKEREYLTIKFTNFTTPIRKDYETFGDVPETLTVDGTVIYKYTDSFWW